MIKASLTILIIPLFFLVSHAQKVEVIKVPDLERMIHNKEDNIILINFWATWCKPCLEELPAFNELSEKYKDEKLQIILVSLDFPSQIESHLIPFIKNNNVKHRVLVLDDPNSNYWINQIDISWSGAIPATLVYNNYSREFYERSFSFNELETIVKLKL